MDNECFGPTARAMETLERFFPFPENCDRQEWEMTLADPAKIDRMLDVLESEPLDIDDRTALCLVTTWSFEEAFEQGEENLEQMSRASGLIRDDRTVFERIRFYWTTWGFTYESSLLKELLSP